MKYSFYREMEKNDRADWPKTIRKKANGKARR